MWGPHGPWTTSNVYRALKIGLHLTSSLLSRFWELDYAGNMCSSSRVNENFKNMDSQWSNLYTLIRFARRYLRASAAKGLKLRVFFYKILPGVHADPKTILCYYFLHIHFRVK